MKLPAQCKLSDISYLAEASSAYQTSAKEVESRKLKTESLKSGFSSLAAVALIGLVLAVFLGLIGTGTIKIPGSKGLPVSPLPVSDPVEDDEACNDPYNADCEALQNDPEDLTPEQIQKALEEK